jgi:YfiH family protein
MSIFLTADNLTAAKIRHGFFTRLGGVSEGGFASLNIGLGTKDHPENVAENRARIARAMGVAPEHLLTCRQIHSDRVMSVSVPWDLPHRPEADAMVTDVRGLALGVLTADCVPVLFADATAGVIGAAHAGWRGALSALLENTCQAMERLGAQRGRVRAAIGPCIGPESYEVGPDFEPPFIKEDEANKSFFKDSAKAGHKMFDLPAYVFQKLETLGIANISPSPADTCHDEGRFFSYRRSCLMKEAEAGRQLSVIVLPEEG